MSRNIKLRDELAARASEESLEGPYGADVFPSSPCQTAAYIHDIARELHLMARRAELTFLAYLLEIASQEAESRKHGGGGRNGG